MYTYVQYKGLRLGLRPKKVTDKINVPKSVDAFATTLCPSISELRGRLSQRQMAPWLPCPPNLNKCQVSAWQVYG